MTMPTRAPTICAEPGCPQLATHASRCPTHQRTDTWTGGASGRRMPPGWQATRRRILTRDRHTCQHCGAPATDVDHTTRGAGEHDTNLQALCHRCHTAKTQAEAAQARR